MIRATNEGTLNVYIKSLENQIENKRYFLQQTRNAIQKLKDEKKESKSTNEVDEAIWQEFLRKVMFFPERSDPIGISLASTSLRIRNKTSREAIESLEINYKNTNAYTSYFKNINSDLEELVNLIKQRVESESNEEDPNLILLPSQKNKILRRQLNNLIEEYISIDLLSSQNMGSERNSKRVKKLLSRLINYDDSLLVSDFFPEYKDLYRLLSKTNIVDVIEQESTGEKHIRLLDFSSIDL
ncbi:hypothetical protein TPHA_0L00220 [Tetrapisispora phaffii CBS 4417]|uniref:Uncharacterized protein n=1 Tax=Tetrapisispora phaffii (strain ATCC 24235 / CBS 4417 / NBRC 1672 / NRRL Y-8282 / UCD 70-5) TaxID=1071381 RepID=G8BZQ1_TETPH|nr:hypothetical protein TPHA_0L00220 [Tetrapisispora phaffii CBS 4417]CCE65379.1 hypothetical protein TPHA_0L00220 [Tetrapisispora phaffii CBS 4417]